MFSRKSWKLAMDAGEQDLVIPADRRIGSCMTHRSDIVWIDSASKKNDILETVLAHPDIAYFPVCAKTVDSVLGVLPARAFLASLQAPAWPGLKALVKKPVYLPETVTIARALPTIAESGCKMAFIIDEYGGIEGLVTKNGLMGELLDDFARKDSEHDPDIVHRADGSWLISGNVRMEEIAESINLPAPESGDRDYYTLAGYILSVNGSIPKTGDIIPCGEWKCEIMDMDGHRIDKVLVSGPDGASSVQGTERGIPDAADKPRE